MSEEPIRIPDALREAVGRDLEPVKPLAEPWKRLVYAGPVVLFVLMFPFWIYRIRGDREFDVLLGWIPVAIQLLLALGLLLFALRESIPGRRVSARAIFLLCCGAFALHILVNLAIYLRLPDDGTAPHTVEMWLACFRVESLIGLPILILVAWLVARALPQRPWLAGMMAGLGAGFAADASWRLICNASDPPHVLSEHTAGIVLLGLTGALLGYLWSLFEARARRAGSTA